jgi:hypothetical protein
MTRSESRSRLINSLAALPGPARSIAISYLKKFVREHDEHEIVNYFRGVLTDPDPRVSDVLKKSSEHLSPRCGSEAVLSIGAGIEWMENPRFVKGELGTHFIDQETTLMGDMKRILEREKTLEEKLPHVSDEKKRIAAIAAVTTISQIHGHRY